MKFRIFLLRSYKKNKELRFLIAGAWNTVFGYLIGLFIYHALENLLNIVFVLIIAYVVSVTQSFFVYKFFVFKTSGNWLSEYIKCYYLSAINAIIGIIGVYLLLEKLNIAFWIAQGIMLIMTLIFSYVGLKNYIFNKL